MPSRERKEEPPAFDNAAYASQDEPSEKSEKAVEMPEETSSQTDKKFTNSDEKKMVSILGMFRYADTLDKILLFVGTIVALAAAGVYPLMFLLYGSTATVLVDSQKNATAANFTCPAPESNESYDDRLDRNINYYVAAGFTSLFLSYVFSVCFDTAAERQTKRIRNLLFKSLVIQEMAFFDKNSPGELASRITSNVLTLKAGFNFKFGDFISLAGRGIGCLILAFASSWKFSLVFMAIMPFLTAFTCMLFFTIKKYTVREFQSYGDAGKIAQEVLSSLRTVVSFGTMKKEIKNYETNLKKAEAMFIQKGRVTGIFLGLTLGLFNCLFGVAIYYAVYLTRTTCIAPGTVIQSLMSLITSTFALGQAGPFLKDLAEARGAALKIFEIIEKKPEIETYKKEGKKRIANFKGQISFNNVFFSYPQRKQTTILKGLTMNLEAGKTIALCGSSGGGKSTVIQLLERFYDPTSGLITIDGEDIQDLELSWLRSQMALVSQEPVLFSTSIRENIRLGRQDATDDEIVEAAKLANVHDFILSTTSGYDTHVGERGSQLSGGQKQRVAIARAILRNPKILLLDEATSALDNQSEKVVQEALDRAKVGRTTIIIAHRLTTIRNADLIIAMDKGKIGEMGTHDELMTKRGLYYELVTSQTKEAESDGVNKKEDKVAFKKMKSVESKRSEKVNEDEEDEIEEFEMEEDAKGKAKKVKKEKVSILKLSRKMWQLNRPELWFAVVGAICQIICSLVNPVVSLIFSEIYSLFANPDPKEQESESLKFMGIIIGIGFINFVCTIIHHTSFAVVGGRLTTRIRLRMFESMLRQEMAYHDQEENRSSILATRLAATVPFCKGLTSEYLGLICQTLAGVGFSIIVSFVINWKLSLVIMAFIPAVFISGITSINSISGKGKGKSTNEEGGQLATEITENIKTVASLGREKHFVKQFEAIYNKNFTKTLIKLHMQSFFYGLTNSILFFIQAAAFSFGFYLIKRNELTITSLFRVYASITFSSMALGRVFAQMPDTKKTTEAALVALRTINRKSKIDSMSEEGLRPATLKGEIRFNDVHFNYPSRPKLKVLQGISLKVNPGQVNALVGSSGCGKSTTVALLLRFYDVDSGSVTIDGIDVRELNIQWLRSQIGVVSQEPTLFNTSIRDNITYGVLEGNVSDEDVRNVAKDANISARIESLPMQYGTVVGTKGGQLSGGEKQRVAIARALLRQPKILLLDEATSALDSQSEQVVQETLDAAQKGRTCLVIAHRLSTIHNSDKISVFEKGRVIEEGTHQQLLANKNLYYKLNSQNVSH